MNKHKILLISLVAIFFGIQGCSWHHADISALSNAQQDYYKRLGDMLSDKQQTLNLAFDNMQQADSKHRRELLQWARDIRKTDILLHGDVGVAGNENLFLMQLASITLADQYQPVSEIDQAQVKSLKELYDKIKEAVKVLAKNNDVLVKYLGSKESEFALQSLDMASVVQIISAVRKAQEDLGKTEKRTDDERKKEQEQILKGAEQARETLLKVISH
jgi:archaellum component FlaF (FlaF/FlaG flagellin family)